MRRAFHDTLRGRLPGLLLVAGASVLIMKVAAHPAAQKIGLSSLTLAIMLGMVLGNTLFGRVAGQCSAGVDFSKSALLQLGVILYGFRITFGQIASVGWKGILMDALVIACTFGLTLLLGLRLLKMDRDTVILIGAGSSICGAAAVLATEPVVRSHAHKVSVAIATVVVFGTLSMFIYPLLYPRLGLSEAAYGLYVGSTVHEVAQVVTAAGAVSDLAVRNAVIEKMLRVMMLSPFLMLLSLFLSSGGKRIGAASRARMPWFAIGFVAVSGVGSLAILPPPVVDLVVRSDLFLLTMAMFALGLRTSAGAIRQAGFKPLLLAGLLFLFLSVGGYGINRFFGL